MPQLPQALDRLLRQPLLAIHRQIMHDLLALLHEPLLLRRHARPDANPRRIEGLLGRQTAHNLAEQHLDVALGLHEAAHDPEHTMQRPAITQAEIRHRGGDDGMVGSLARRQHVRVGGVEREVRGPVLQREAAARRDDARAEAAVVAVDEADGVPLRVRHREVDRVGALQGGRAARGDPRRGGGREEMGALGEVCRREQGGRGHLLDVRVRHVPGRVGEAEAQRLDDRVEVGRRVEVLRSPGRDLPGLLELLDDAQRDQSHDALPVRRVFPELQPYVFFFFSFLPILISIIASDNTIPQPLLDAQTPQLKTDRLHRLAARLEVVREII